MYAYPQKYRGEIFLFRAVANNMALTHEVSLMNHLMLFLLNISLFLVSTLWYRASGLNCQ